MNAFFLALDRADSWLLFTSPVLLRATYLKHILIENLCLNNVFGISMIFPKVTDVQLIRGRVLTLQEFSKMTIIYDFNAWNISVWKNIYLET